MIGSDRFWEIMKAVEDADHWCQCHCHSDHHIFSILDHDYNKVITVIHENEDEAWERAFKLFRDKNIGQHQQNEYPNESK